MAEIREHLTQPSNEAARRKVRPGRSAGGSSEVASADAEVSAAIDLWIGDQAGAASKAREAADLPAFWRYVQAHALFNRGRAEDLAAAHVALEDATANGPRTAWFRRLGRTVADLKGHEHTADDTPCSFGPVLICCRAVVWMATLVPPGDQD